MIRRAGKNDWDEVMDIWLNANIEAHSFIDEDYWRGNFDSVREIIPKAEVFVSENNGQVNGFIGLSDDYIEGIFVKSSERSKGIGTELLCAAKDKKDVLSLSVYKKNTKAVLFYQNAGFEITEKRIDENTLEEEYTMAWHR